jgi:hypothetical protein
MGVLKCNLEGMDSIDNSMQNNFTMNILRSPAGMATHAACLSDRQESVNF